MKRRLFALLPLVGAASAQQWKDGGITTLSGAQPEHKALNGQCPVCGTMAEPWKQRIDCAGWHDNMTEAEKRRGYALVPCGDFQRQERCSRCNASFWTDAANKPKDGKE